MGARPPRAHRRESGFSLIELMVALTLGLFIVLALTSVLINVNRNNTEMSRNNSVIENGRFVLQLLDMDLSHAGFWGGFLPAFDDLTATSAPADRPTAVPDPCLAYTAANWNTAYQGQLIGIPVQVYEVSSTGSVPTIGTCATSPNVLTMANAKPNTHVLVVRHASACVQGGSTDEDCTLDDKAIYFQTSRCSTDASTSQFKQYDAASGAVATQFALHKRDCATSNEVYKYVSHVYWIRDYASAAGDGIPTLMRSTFKVVGTVPKHASSDALVEGVEGFRVDLALDNVSRSGAALAASDFDSTVTWASTTNLTTPINRGDGSPDTLVQCTATSACTAFQLMNVVGVKLNVLMRAPTKTPGYTDGKTYTLGTGTNAISLGPFTDGYKRHLYTQMVRLTNVSMRREVAP